jgi:hypothetical protein
MGTEKMKGLNAIFAGSSAEKERMAAEAEAFGRSQAEAVPANVESPPASPEPSKAPKAMRPKEKAARSAPQSSDARNTSFSLSQGVLVVVADLRKRHRWSLPDVLREGVVTVKAGQMKEAEAVLASLDSHALGIRSIVIEQSVLDTLDVLSSNWRMSRTQVASALILLVAERINTSN